MNTPPSRDGRAGSFRTTAAITNTGGIRAMTLMLEDASINAVISFRTPKSGALEEACIKPITAYATSAISREVPVV